MLAHSSHDVTISEDFTVDSSPGGDHHGASNVEPGEAVKSYKAKDDGISPCYADAHHGPPLFELVPLSHKCFQGKS